MNVRDGKWYAVMHNNNAHSIHNRNFWHYLNGRAGLMHLGLWQGNKNWE
jgi:hypothetical protein